MNNVVSGYTKQNLNKMQNTTQNEAKKNFSALCIRTTLFSGFRIIKILFSHLQMIPLVFTAELNKK